MLTPSSSGRTSASAWPSSGSSSRCSSAPASSRSSTSRWTGGTGEPRPRARARLADVADAVALARFRALDLLVETKPDRTPVTEADRPSSTSSGRARAASGAATRSSARSRARRGSGRRRWIVDPIDGTRNYSRGIPVWATLIALEEDGDVVLGVVSAPALGRRWWAERGGGAYAGGDAACASRGAARRGRRALLRARAAAARPRGRAWHAARLRRLLEHMLVAEGSVDGAIDAIGVSVWDLAAVQVIVEEAGGTFTDFAASTASTAAARSRRTATSTRRCSRRSRPG